mmetsp:Transcript_61862/g.124003  ORF Transcript_61862/g.124003 Transcript_61862/m.124003 type:complete len:235 (-) Transcript_61862:247-951(-)
MGCACIVHRVDERDVLPRDHLGEGPAERAVGPRKVHAAVELVHLVQNDDELVVQARERPRQHVQRLACGAWPIRVEEQQNEVRALGKPTDNLQEVVAAPAGHLRAHLDRHVDHARRVHNLQPHGHGAALRQDQALASEVAPERLAEALELLEGPVLRATQEGGPVLDLIRGRMPLEDGEAVVGRRHARLLHLNPQHAVDEGGLAGRVVADDQHHRRERKRQEVMLEGAPRESCI